MVKLENAETLIKFQIFIASSLLIVGLAISCIKTTSSLKDCKGAGADILLLVDMAHPGWHETMLLYSRALMDRFAVGRQEQLCRFRKVEYIGSPMQAVDMEFLQSTGADEDNDNGRMFSTIKMTQKVQGINRSSSTTTPTLLQTVRIVRGPLNSHPRQRKHTPIKFLIILSVSEDVVTAESEETIAKVASLNVTTIVAAFDYLHKIPFDDLTAIASDGIYVFVAEHLHANVLIDQIVNVVCREVKANVLYSDDLSDRRDVTYDCDEANPCSIEILRQNVHTFPYRNPTKFVHCQDVNECVIGECIYGYSWNMTTRLCH